MDVIKTSLIIAIDITFYYLHTVACRLLVMKHSEDIIVNTISDSEPPITALEPLSSG